MALVVAFGSSSLRQSTEEELFALRHQLEQMRRDNQTLEEKIRWVEGRYSQTLTLGRRLNEALLEEQKHSRTLAHRLRQAEAAPRSSDQRLRRYSERSIAPAADSGR